MAVTFQTSRFDIRREIGKGGMGVVYEAFDRERNLDVALKVIREVSSDTLHSFKQEFRSIADIVHPNLIGLHELFAEDDQWFFTMELIDGEHFLPYVRSENGEGSSNGFLTPSRGLTPRLPEGFSATGEFVDDGASPLAERRAMFEAAQSRTPAELVVSHLAPRRPPDCDVERLRHVLRQIAQGLVAVHGRGKLHRDIKSSNVMVTTEGRAVILDFGLASTIKELNRMRARGMVGTLAYASPEQTVGEQLSPASDWYSVGVMMYEALTGHSPFMGDTESLLEKKLTTPPPALEEVVEGAPGDLTSLCNALLRIDPSTRPTGREVLEMLNAGAATTYFAGTTPSSVDFIGRQAELELLHQAFETARSGQPTVAMVSGPSGFGKSSLTQKFLDGLPPRQTLVLRGKCYEQESVPYKGMDSAIDTLAELLDLWEQIVEEIPVNMLQALAHVFPVLLQSSTVRRRCETAEEIVDLQMRRRAAFQCLRDIVAALQRHRQLVFCIDDMQWTDAESVQLLSSLLAGSDAPPVLYLTSYRSEYEERNPWLQEWLEAVKSSGVPAFPVSVGAFSSAESEELALRILGPTKASNGPSALKIVGEGEGNPFFIYQLAQSAREQGSKTQALAERITLDSVLRNRVTTLPSSARDLLETIAIAGRPLAKSDAYAAAGLEHQDPVVLNILRIANLTRSFNFGAVEMVETYHDRIRETVANSLPRELARARHRALALQLELRIESATHTEPETLAVHFEGAENHQRAAHYYELAANRASSALAFDKAARFYQKALDLGQFEPSTKFAIGRKLAEALANAGRGKAAAEQYDALSQQAASADSLDLETRAGFLYCSTGHLDQGQKVYDRIISRLGLREPKNRSLLTFHLVCRLIALRVRGLAYKPKRAAEVSPDVLRRLDTIWSLSAGLVLIDIPRSMNFALINLRAALNAGESERLLSAILMSCYVPLATNIGGAAMSGRLLKLGKQLAASINTPKAHAYVEQSSAAIAHIDVRSTDALFHLTAAESLYRKHCTGVSFELAAINAIVLFSLGTIGDYKAMLRRAELTIKEASETGDLYSRTVAETFAAPVGQLALDNPARARRYVEEGLARWSMGVYDAQNAIAACTLGMLTIYEGNAHTLLPYVEKEWALMTRYSLTRHPEIGPTILRIWVRAAIAKAALPETAADERKHLLHVADQKLKVLKKDKAKFSHLTYMTAVAESAFARGQLEEAREGFAACEELYRSMELTSFVASLTRHRGMVMGGEEGNELVRQSDQILAECGVVNPARMAVTLIGGWKLEPLVEPANPSGHAAERAENQTIHK